MKDFNIAKYLKEHNLGAHGILGKYVDLQALKEEETGLGQQKAMKEPYEGPKDPIDGLGGKLDRNMDVSMNEDAESALDKMSREYEAWLEQNNLPPMSADELWYDDSIEKTDAQKKYLEDFIYRWNEAEEELDQIDDENTWMQDVDGTDAYKVGEWTCYYDYPGILAWSFRDEPFSEVAVYATPGYDGNDSTPIQLDVDEITVSNQTINKGVFANFQEYAQAMKPYLDKIASKYIEPGTYDEAKVQEAEEIDMNEYDQLLGAIENLLRQGETAQNILQVVKDTLGMNEAMDFDGEESESGKHDRMMGLIDRTLESQLGKVKKVIDAARNRGLRDMAIFKMLSTWDLTMQSVQDLVNDGFEAQDIVDFFATDFSLSEDDINLADIGA